MNKKLATAFLSTILLALPLVSSAVPFGNQPTTLAIPLDVLFNNLLTYVWWVFIIIAVIFFIVIGVLFLAAEGEPGKLETARRALIWGTAGILVAILAFSIISIVGLAFGLGT